MRRALAIGILLGFVRSSPGGATHYTRSNTMVRGMAVNTTLII